MRKSIIVAATEAGVIGKDNKIPWHIKEDLQHFKKLTMGHHLVMGRKTHESIGRALPGRITMVLTRERFRDVGPDAWRMWNLVEAFAHAKKAGEEELFVCGGGEVYREALPLVDRVYLTVVERRYDGDTKFVFDRKGWRLTMVETQVASPNSPIAFRFEEWNREVRS